MRYHHDYSGGKYSGVISYAGLQCRREERGQRISGQDGYLQWMLHEQKRGAAVSGCNCCLPQGVMQDDRIMDVIRGQEMN